MANNFLELLGINIRKYRLMNCYTQQQLADILYVTKQSISKWEIGKSLPTTENIMYMCPILRCSPNNLLLDSVVLLGYDETRNINYPQKPTFDCVYNNTNEISTQYQNFSQPINMPPNSTTSITNNMIDTHQETNYNTCSTISSSTSCIGKNNNQTKAFVTSHCSSDENVSSNIEKKEMNEYTTSIQNNKSQTRSIFGFPTFKKNQLSMTNSSNEKKIIDIPKFLTKQNIEEFFLNITKNKEQQIDELIENYVNNYFWSTNYDFYGLVVYNKFDDATYIYNQEKHKFDKVMNYKRTKFDMTSSLCKNNIKIKQEEELNILEINEKYYILNTIKK